MSYNFIMKKQTIIATIIIAVGVVGIIGYIARKQAVEYSSAVDSRATDEQKIRDVIGQFAKALQVIDPVNPKETNIKIIQDHYAPFASPLLMEGWTQDPTRAPGRIVPGSEPERIDIVLIDKDDDGAYDVQGRVVAGSAQYPVAIKLRYQNDRWVMTGFTKAAPNGQ